jgi:hypothetical protein
LLSDDVFQLLTPVTSYVPFCRDCGKEVQAGWVTCPYCSASMVDVASKTIGLQDSVVMGDISINDAQQSMAAPHTVGIQPVFTTIATPNHGERIQNIVAISLTIIVISGGIWLVFPEWFTNDDDGDGIRDENDWYDQGDGGLNIEFISFHIWDEGGVYDDYGGNPDVYAYVGLGDGNCNNFQYAPYLDSIHEDASGLNYWEEFAINIPDDKHSACVSVTIYDEDSWALDEILDYVPGSANHYQHQFNLAAGEGDITVFEDNRGENELSISLSYRISRVAVVPA